VNILTLVAENRVLALHASFSPTTTASTFQSDWFSDTDKVGDAVEGGTGSDTSGVYLKKFILAISHFLKSVIIIFL
jgi:hypothetical protein